MPILDTWEKHLGDPDPPFLTTQDARAKLLRVFPQLSSKLDINEFIKLITFIPRYNLQDYIPRYELRVSEVRREDEEEDFVQQAGKLIAIFGSAENAIQYLHRFEKQYPYNWQLIHDASLFTLPDATDQWNVALWSSIVLEQQPLGPEDLIMRLLPLIPKIEEYVKQNRSQLEKNILENVQKEFEIKYSLEFDSNSKSQSHSEETLSDPDSDLVEKETNKRFDHFLRKELAFPLKGKPTGEQIKELKERKISFSEQDLAVYENLRSIVYQELLQQKIKKASTRTTSKTKSEYIAEKIQKEKGTILTIAKQRSERLLSSKTSLKTLQEYADHCVYQNSYRHLSAAKIFFKERISESKFNQYLELVAQDDVNKIPNILIDGKDIHKSYAGFYIKKLSPNDPRAAVLGKLSSCCQSIGDSGEQCAIHGITSVNGGFYVLCKMESSSPSDEDEILAQSWVWRGKDDSFVLDSIESQIDFREKNSDLLIDLFYLLSQKLVDEHKVPKVLVGLGGNTPESFAPLCIFNNSEPVDYEGYRDSHKQHMVVDQRYPTLSKLFKEKNPASKLNVEHKDTIANITASDIETLTDIFEFNRLIYDMEIDIQDYLSEELVFKRKALISMWVDLLNSDEFNANAIKLFITQHGNSLLNLPRNKETRGDFGDTIINYDTALILAVKNGDADLVKWLIKNGADINMKTKEGASAYSISVCAGQLKLAKFLLELGAVPRETDTYGNMPALQYVTLMSKWPETRFLLENIPDVNKRIEYATQLLPKAIQDGNLEIVKWFVDELGLSFTAIEATKSLFEAVPSGNIDLIEYLLGKGANLNAANPDTTYVETILDVAASSKQWDILKWLVETKGVKLDSEKASKFLFSHMTYSRYRKNEKNQLDVAKWLVKNGADIHYENVYMGGKSLQNLVVDEKQWDIVKWLIEEKDAYRNSSSTTSVKIKFFGLSPQKYILEDILPKAKEDNRQDIVDLINVKLGVKNFKIDRKS